jgi:hypothetical protein
MSNYNLWFFFCTPSKLKKDDATQVGFLEDLMLFVVKGLLLMSIVEFIWLQRLTYKLCPWIVFPSKKKKIEEILPSLVEKTMMCLFLLILFQMIGS